LKIEASRLWLLTIEFTSYRVNGGAKIAELNSTPKELRQNYFSDKRPALCCSVYKADDHGPS